MFILGVTGAIASGKSTVENMLEKQGIPTLDADQVVHQLYLKDQPVQQQLLKWLGEDILTPAGDIDRHKLSDHLRQNPSDTSKLEQIVHPAVRQFIQRWLQQQHQNNVQMVALSVPLMFDAGFNKLCDLVLACVSTAEIRKQRFMARDNASLAKWQMISQKQMTDAEYQQMADFALNTQQPIEETAQQLAQIVKKCHSIKATAYNLWA
ncbi:MAG: dephospho-CoA kinase [Pseudomonadota bacterium]|nr:dephospho-CoA kinase [Pseudomonadota bacterium]MEC8467926.1 dephospho-CoA kinase [Pseudomonadota bacterium]